MIADDSRRSSHSRSHAPCRSFAIPYPRVSHYPIGAVMDIHSLAGRTAVVTGASRGIGAATARALDKAGARVALVARTADALDAVAADLQNDPLVIAADLRTAIAPAEVAERAAAEFGTIDILVNNAAAAARLPTVEMDAGLIDDLLAVNVRAPLLLI